VAPLATLGEESRASECISVGARSQNGNRGSQNQSAYSHKEEVREAWEYRLGIRTSTVRTRTSIVGTENKHRGNHKQAPWEPQTSTVGTGTKIPRFQGKSCPDWEFTRL